MKLNKGKPKMCEQEEEMSEEEFKRQGSGIIHYPIYTHPDNAILALTVQDDGKVETKIFSDRAWEWIKTKSRIRSITGTNISTIFIFEDGCVFMKSLYGYECIYNPNSEKEGLVFNF
jgi:hypothetical protein